MPNLTNRKNSYMVMKDTAHFTMEAAIMFEKLKNFLVNSLGFFGYGIFYMLLCAIVYAPIFVLDLPWYATFIATFLFCLFPSIGVIALPVLTIVAFPRAISRGLCASSILFYVSVAVYIIPALVSLASLFFQWISSAVARISGKVSVEQPEMWYTCPRCGSLVHSGVTCDCGFAPVGKKFGSPKVTVAVMTVSLLLLCACGVLLLESQSKIDELSAQIDAMGARAEQQEKQIFALRDQNRELCNDAMSSYSYYSSHGFCDGYSAAMSDLHAGIMSGSACMDDDYVFAEPFDGGDSLHVAMFENWEGYLDAVAHDLN